MTTAIKEYSKTDAALASLAKRYKGAKFEVTTKIGMQDAKAARAELRGYRVTLEATRVEIKAPALERCRLIDAEATRIHDAIVLLEGPIVEQIRAEEERVAREAEIELKRVAAELAAKQKAEDDRIAAEQKAAREAEEKRIADANAEIARRQAELDAAEKQRAAAEAESRRKIEEEERAARERIAAAEREARAKIEAAEHADRLLRMAAETKAKAEEDERVRVAKAEADRIAAEERAKQLEEQKAKDEADRAARKLLNAREALQEWVTTFGDIEEFEEIAITIRQWLGA